jgi:hypothetical protein
MSHAHIDYGDVLDVLEDRPMTAKAVATELLAPWQTVASILNRAERKGHVVLVGPTPGHPVVRYALSTAEIAARRCRLRRTVLPVSVRAVAR